MGGAVGDCCVSLKMLKSPHKEICSFKLTMLCLSLSSSLSLSPGCIDSALCLDMGFWEVPKGENENNQFNMAAPSRPQSWCHIG